MLPTIDIKLALEQAAGNEALAKDLFTMLVNELPALNMKIAQAISDDNFTLMWDHAHKLYGSTAYCGVPALRDSARQLEVAIKTANKQQITQCYQAVDKQIQHLVNNAADYLKQAWVS